MSDKCEKEREMEGREMGRERKERRNRERGERQIDWKEGKERIACHCPCQHQKALLSSFEGTQALGGS